MRGPRGLLFGASTLVCTPCSLADDGLALGAQAGQHLLRRVLDAAGFHEAAVAARTRSTSFSTHRREVLMTIADTTAAHAARVRHRHLVRLARWGDRDRGR
jgi:hypothetical protein